MTKITKGYFTNGYSCDKESSLIGFTKSTGMGTQHPSQPQATEVPQESRGRFSGRRISLKLLYSVFPLIQHSDYKNSCLFCTTVQLLHKPSKDELIHLVRVRNSQGRHFLLNKWAPSLSCQGRVLLALRRFITFFLPFLSLLLIHDTLAKILLCNLNRANFF